MSKARFTKHLKELNIEEMRYELLNLYNKLQAVREHYAMELGSDKDREKIFNRAKKNIDAKYATKSYGRPRRPRIQKINAILSAMKKTSIFNHEMADLYLYDVEAALVFILKYHFYSHVLGNHIVTTFKRALLIIEQEQIHDMFRERCKMIVDRSELTLEIHWNLIAEYKSCF